jgi:hypothetical protein
MSDEPKELARCLGDALDKIDSAIAIRDDEAIEGFRDLDLIRAELHSLTCRPQLAKFYAKLVRP